MHAASVEKVRAAASKRSAENEDQEQQQKKQQKLQQNGSLVSHIIPQYRVDQLIIDFVVGYMEPMSVVEEPTFIAMVTGMQPNRKVMTRKTLEGNY